MYLLDANILIYAIRAESENHEFFNNWLTDFIESGNIVHISDSVISSVIRICTNRRVFKDGNLVKTEIVIDALEAITIRPNCRVIHSNPSHLYRFLELCVDMKIVGDLVPDAYIAALAIDNNCTLVSTDKDFRRFKGLKVLNPADDSR